MRSCIVVFYILGFALSGDVAAQPDPDALYRERADLSRARQAAAIYWGVM